MTDQEIRLECLRLANCLDTAKMFYEWVSAQPMPPVNVKPGAFVKQFYKSYVQGNPHDVA